MKHGTDAGYQAHYKKGGDRKPCQPCKDAHTERCRRARGGSTGVDAAARLEDIAWMIETGETATGAARRLDLSRSSLETWLRRHNAYELWAALTRREHLDDYRSTDRASAA